MKNEINNGPRSMAPSISKHRLTDISHHFLSNENERLPVWKNTFIIPVLLSSKNDDYLVYELDKAFNQQHRSSMVLNIEASLNEIGSLTPIMPDNKTDQPIPDFCLIPVTSTSTTRALQSDRLIIAVHASLQGVRAAYNQLAFLASLKTDFNVFVIMLGAKTTHEANRFYEFLCDSSESLLELELECGGFLLQNNNEITLPEDDEQDVATDMHGVAKGILHEFTPGLRIPGTDPASTSHALPDNKASLYLT
ncbi:MAG: hypothetical protein V3R49_06300 [Gammaproteobacteria bacterium]